MRHSMLRGSSRAATATTATTATAKETPRDLETDPTNQATVLNGSVRGDHCLMGHRSAFMNYAPIPIDDDAAMVEELVSARTR